MGDVFWGSQSMRTAILDPSSSGRYRRIVDDVSFVVFFRVRLGGLVVLRVVPWSLRGHELAEVVVMGALGEVEGDSDEVIDRSEW
jgi:hypothetical protein